MRIGYYRLLFVAVIASLGAHMSLGQAYFVDSKGDTLQGVIEKKQVGERLVDFYYKPEKKAPGQLLSPQEVQGFMTKKGRVFRPIDIGGEEQKWVFAVLMTESRMSLYRHDGQFYLEKEGEIHGLAYDKFETPRGEYSVIQTSNKYLRVMSALMADCPGLSTEIQKTMYTHKSIENMVNIYNLCHNAPSADFPN